MSDSSTKQERVILALLSSATLEDAAEKAGVSARTLRRWFHDERFTIALEAARRDLWNHQLHRLVALSQKALTALELVLDDQNETTRNRIAAARTVLDSAASAYAGDIEQRLAELEKTLETSTIGGLP